MPGLAVCAANKQGKFSEMEHLIWTKGFAERDLSPERMGAIATEAGLDLVRYGADLRDPACNAWLERSQQQLAAVGTAGTPAFYVNGRFLSGAQPFGNFKRLIDEELAKADKAIAAGTPAEAYYQSAVVDKGLKSL